VAQIRPLKNHQHRGSVSQGSGYAYRILKFAAGSFGMDPVLLTESSVVGPCYEIWEYNL
jgi:hypothetical protein